MKSQIY